MPGVSEAKFTHQRCLGLLYTVHLLKSVLVRHSSFLFLYYVLLLTVVMHPTLLGCTAHYYES